MKKLLPISLLLIMLSAGDALSQARVGYTTFGEMINIPTSSHLIGPDFLKFGFGMELNSLSPFKASQGIFFDFEPSILRVLTNSHPSQKIISN